jgi:hypothetical protein
MGGGSFVLENAGLARNVIFIRYVEYFLHSYCSFDMHEATQQNAIDMGIRKRSFTPSLSCFLPEESPLAAKINECDEKRLFRSGYGVYFLKRRSVVAVITAIYNNNISASRDIIVIKPSFI